MGEMTREQVIDALKKDSPKAKLSDVVIYADAYLEYQAAQANIREHGSIVFHPRTGSPIDNPYIKIRNSASAIIRKITSIKASSLWESKID